jgi:catechol 2,3-dioxygenase-like lactoylglutathione lyase family enzyme
MSIRLHHVSIPIPRGHLDDGAAFYREAFGLHEIEPPESLGRQRVRWFALGDRELHLFIEDDANSRVSGRHLAFEVNDLEAMQLRLSEHGVEIEGADPIDNRPRFFCHDPFGNRVEVTQLLGPYR